MIHWSQQVAATKLSCPDQVKLSLLTRLVKPEEHYSVYTVTHKQQNCLSDSTMKESANSLHTRQTELENYHLACPGLGQGCCLRGKCRRWVAAEPANLPASGRREMGVSRLCRPSIPPSPSPAKPLQQGLLGGGC